MEEKKKMPIIVTPFGSKQKISEEMNVSREFVNKSLSYMSNSEKAREIRSIAVEKYGGVETFKMI